ncbi:hypothetical protein B0H34DRAFT_802997 [Crassisporium funariophilum]|nr:hypothetical protein B0H34DRAFT_802997 [Crassisporium funariophilum]
MAIVVGYYKKSTSCAYWTPSDKVVLLDFLVEKKSEGGEGGFKTTTWVAAAAKVNATKTCGGDKSKDSCRAKYQLLKATYEVVCTIRGNSGWSWDDELGANIDSDIEAKEGKWLEYIEHHPDAAPFCNKGWPYLSQYNILCGHAAPKGSHVFHASQTPTVTASNVTNEAGGLDDDWIDTEEGSEVETMPEDSQLTATPPRSAIQRHIVSGRKHAASSVPHPSDPKRVRKTPSSKLIGCIASSYDWVTSLLEKALLPDGPSTPARKQSAIAQAMELEEDWLSGYQLACLIDVLEKETYAAEGYVQVAKNTKLCKNWV